MPVFRPVNTKLRFSFWFIGVFLILINPLVGKTKTNLQISYTLDVHQPHTHLFKVAIAIENVKTPHLDFALPVWIPGYNRIRNFARNIQDLNACDGNAVKLQVVRLDKQTWRVIRGKSSTIKLTYKVYANNLQNINIASHIDETHAFFNGAGIFLYTVGAQSTPVVLKIDKPKEWKIATGLEKTAQRDTFFADSYDQLIDCPTEMGNFAQVDFIVEDKPHHLVFYGLESIDAGYLKNDITRIVKTCSTLFGDLPYKGYTFIYHLTERERRSGVEHSNSTAIIFNKMDFHARRNYDQLISVTAHEFFHLWNIKRIKPEGWGPFDYTQVPQTKSHWFTEGITSYYTSLILVRSGVWSKEKFYQDIAARISEFEQKPGKNLMSLEEASWNIVLKPDNARDTTISYYVKGAVVGFMLDCEIRKRTANRKTLDDVLRYLNEHFAKKGQAYRNQQILQIINKISGSDFSDFYRKYIAGTENIPYRNFLHTAGLKLVITEDKPVPYLGIETQPAPGNFVNVAYVAPGSPAYECGIDAEDILLALNGQRLTFTQWRDHLNRYKDGEKITITLFHKDRLIEKKVTLRWKQNSFYRIQEVDNPSENQLRLRASLLGTN